MSKTKRDCLMEHYVPGDDVVGCLHVGKPCRGHSRALKQYSQYTCIPPAHWYNWRIGGGMGFLRGHHDARVHQLSPAYVGGMPPSSSMGGNWEWSLSMSVWIRVQVVAHTIVSSLPFRPHGARVQHRHSDYDIFFQNFDILSHSPSVCSLTTMSTWDWDRWPSNRVQILDVHVQNLHEPQFTGWGVNWIQK